MRRTNLMATVCELSKLVPLAWLAIRAASHRHNKISPKRSAFRDTVALLYTTPRSSDQTTSLHVRLRRPHRTDSPSKMTPKDPSPIFFPTL
jgi:hypothetical protein